MSPYYILGTLLVTLGCVQSGVIPPFEKDPDCLEIWELGNLAEPPPNVIFFPHTYNQDRLRAKIPPHDRLKSLIKAILKYDTNHDTATKKKQANMNLLTSNEDLYKGSRSSNEDTNSSPHDDSEPQIVVEVVPKEKPEKPISTETEVDVLNEQKITKSSSSESEAVEVTTQKPEVLLEDIADSIIHIPSIWSSDKMHRYTHSIRHGYGVPLQYSHIR